MSALRGAQHLSAIPRPGNKLRKMPQGREWTQQRGLPTTQAPGRTELCSLLQCKTLKRTHDALVQHVPLAKWMAVAVGVTHLHVEHKALQGEA